MIITVRYKYGVSGNKWTSDLHMEKVWEILSHGKVYLNIFKE